MPRRKAAASATVTRIAQAPGPTDAAILATRVDAAEDQIQAGRGDDSSVFNRWMRLKGLIESADAAGVTVPPLVRAELPSIAELAEEYTRLKVEENALTAQVKILRDHLLAELEAGRWNAEEQILGTGGTAVLILGSGYNGGGLNPARLLELGVSQAVLDRATDPGAPFYKLELASRRKAEA